MATWAKGIEGQRRADLGNGEFLNPILSGDHPDPTVLRDGSDFYMTFSSFDSYPGLVIWHSQDLVNWQPIGPALMANIGSVWAPELCKYDGRYFLYIPTAQTAASRSRKTNWVIWSDTISGPWSDPIDLNLPDHIDPGHAVGEDGSRWLFLSNGDRVQLTQDGLSTVGEVEHVFDAWEYPDDWIVESFSPEGPKIFRRGDYFYLVLAIGGTAGPPTGHMVIAARSRSINGPWEHHPRNPLVRTVDAGEAWWSRGHATIFEGPHDQWWTVYHGYERGLWTLGRQALLAPVSWADDGWFDCGGGDLSTPLPKPIDQKDGRHGFALSDDFRADKYGLQWAFHDPSPKERERLRIGDGRLELKARGDAPFNSHPLLFVVGDAAYQFDCKIDVDPGATAGLLLFYDDRLYCGLSFSQTQLTLHRYGNEHSTTDNTWGSLLYLRVRNDRQIVTLFTSHDGQEWQNFGIGVEVSGYHHNVRGGFRMLKPGLHAAGTGSVRFSDFKYSAI